jgi:putative thiamine transport system permease protein
MTAAERRGQTFQAAVILIVAAGLIMPIVAGTIQTGQAAFGVLPAIGATSVSLAPWQELFALPGFAAAVRLSLVTGLGATAVSLVLAIGFVTVVHGRGDGQNIGRWLAPFLATPHAALAIGLAFVIAPSGWIARGFAALLGWDRPPLVATVNDPLGLALIVGLVVKEVPFLVLVILAALTQIPVRQQLKAGRSLGYRREVVWLKIVGPQLWPLIRLPVLVVLAYSLSVVDMAVILGPSNPPTLAVLLTRLVADPDLAQLLPASAGAVVQFILVVGAFGLAWLAERTARALGRAWLQRGARRSWGTPAVQVLASLTGLTVVVSVFSIAALVIWSVAWRWPWPLLMPESWSARAWIGSAAGWSDALATTLVLACASTGLSLLLAIAWLEGEDRAGRRATGPVRLVITLPLLIPQVSFLFGLNGLLLNLDLSGALIAVIWAHSLFVFPYVMIALSDPWHARDRRLDRAAAALGAGPWRRLVRIKLPVLLAPLCTAAAIGIAVSVGQYLPTLFIGGGRIATLTTEAVTLASSSDRRVVGVYASLQALVPLVAFALAIAWPAWRYRDHRDLTGSAPA